MYASFFKGEARIENLKTQGEGNNCLLSFQIKREQLIDLKNRSPYNNARGVLRCYETLLVFFAHFYKVYTRLTLTCKHFSIGILTK